MTETDQAEIWSRRSSGTTVEMVLGSYRNPCPFQTEFAEYLNGLAASLNLDRRAKVCEMGSEFGVTSLLLSEKLFERHALDLNPRPIELLSAAAGQLGQEIYGHTGDMFRTEWADETFDIVFNNGVLEHYDFEMRAAALRECARITRHDGYVIVGVPNHCSPPYRFAYLLRRALGRWPYPSENKIVSLARELNEVPSLESKRVLFFDQETVFAILPSARVTSQPFRFLHRWAKFEPYLRVFELVRSRAETPRACGSDAQLRMSNLWVGGGVS